MLSTPVCLQEAAEASVSLLLLHMAMNDAIYWPMSPTYSIGSRQYLEYPPEDRDHEASMSARLLECSSR